MNAKVCLILFILKNICWPSTCYLTLNLFLSFPDLNNAPLLFSVSQYIFSLHINYTAIMLLVYVMSPWPQSHIPICYSLLSIERPQSHPYPYTILYCRSRDLSQTHTHMLFFTAGGGTSATRTHILFFIVSGGTSVIEHTHILFFIVDGGTSVTHIPIYY